MPPSKSKSNTRSPSRSTTTSTAPSPLFRRLATIGLILSLLYPLSQFYTTLARLGVFRGVVHSNVHASAPGVNSLVPVLDRFILEDIVGAEDLALGPGGWLVFVGQADLAEGGYENEIGNENATERDTDTGVRGRHGWFPPLENYRDVRAGRASRGEVWVVHPRDWKPVKLPIKGFDLPFVSHGIALYMEQAHHNRSQTSHDEWTGINVYLHAINHPPDSDSDSDSRSEDQSPHLASSRVEIFQLDINPASPTFGATHLHTIRHSLVWTPNDILPLGPKEMLLSNDHVHKTGVWRGLEDVVDWGRVARGTVVHVRVDQQDGIEPDKTQGWVREGDVLGRVVLKGLHNPNGLGWGRDGQSGKEALLCDAAGGVMHTLKVDAGAPTLKREGEKQSPASTISPAPHSHPHPDTRFTLTSSVHFPNAIDNPFYFPDTHGVPGNDISAYVLGGVLKGAALGPHAHVPTHRNPWSVHLARKRKVAKEERELGDQWEVREIIIDDGRFVDALASAIVVPVAEAEAERERGLKGVDGKREAWVVLTSFFARGVGVVRVDLTDWARGG